MLGLGSFYLIIEWFSRTERQLRALLNLQVASLYGVPY